MSVYLTVCQDMQSDGLQISIDTENGGYRLAGPKFAGMSKVLLVHKLTKRDAEEIRSYLKKMRNTPLTRNT